MIALNVTARPVQAPHSGDSAPAEQGVPQQMRQAPENRGSTPLGTTPHHLRNGSPAHAGMVQTGRSRERSSPSNPRAAGDNPCLFSERKAYSPQAPSSRGWSMGKERVTNILLASPARAGMIRHDGLNGKGMSAGPAQPGMIRPGIAGSASYAGRPRATGDGPPFHTSGERPSPTPGANASPAQPGMARA